MMIEVQNKSCSKCGETKPLTSFQKAANSKDGRRSACRACRSVAKNPTSERVGIRPELNVWKQEFERVCTCVECGGVPVFPDVTTVEEAREAVKASVTRCSDHQGVLTLRAKLRSRKWAENVAQTISEIDFLHDITVTLKNFPHEQRREGAAQWLAGHRDNLTEDLVDLMHERYERTLDLDTRAAVKEAFPILTTERRWAIRGMETYEGELESDDDATCGFEGLTSIYNAVQ